jgi:hypothetical protein
MRVHVVRAHDLRPAIGDRRDPAAAARESTRGARASGRWPLLSGRDSQPEGSLVAAFVAEQKSADHSGALLRFVHLDILVAALRGGRVRGDAAVAASDDSRFKHRRIACASKRLVDTGALAVPRPVNRCAWQVCGAPTGAPPITSQLGPTPMAPTIVSLDDQSDRRARSQMTTRLVTEPVQRVGLADNVSPASKRLLELLGAGHAKQFHMAAAVRRGSQLNDVELVGGFDPGCSVHDASLAPVKPEVTARGSGSARPQSGEIRPTTGSKSGLRDMNRDPRGNGENRKREGRTLTGGPDQRRVLARSIGRAEDASAQQAAGSDVGRASAGVEPLPATFALHVVHRFRWAWLSTLGLVGNAMGFGV